MVTKLTVFILMLCIVYIIKEAIRFLFAYKTTSKFETTPLTTGLTLAAIAYIFTIIFTGIDF